MNFKKNNLIFLGLLAAGFFIAGTAKAICPLCVVAIGAGLGLSRWLGVDDAVSSIWIGALLVALIAWTIAEMDKKKWRFPFDVAIISLAYYLLTFIPLYYSHVVGLAYNKIFGIDKIVFGTMVGTVVFILSYGLHLYLKKKNSGKVFFNYQKVAIPFVILLLTSITFYLLILWRII